MIYSRETQQCCKRTNSIEMNMWLQEESLFEILSLLKLTLRWGSFCPILPFILL